MDYSKREIHAVNVYGIERGFFEDGTEAANVIISLSLTNPMVPTSPGPGVTVELSIPSASSDSVADIERRALDFASRVLRRMTDEKPEALFAMIEKHRENLIANAPLNKESANK